METDYILPHALVGEQQRLALMSKLLDPLHHRLLKSVGLKKGLQCLEVGSGNGSISQWMSKRVGSSGHVVATDIDLQYMKGLGKSNLEVRPLNILKERPEFNKYDLITARAVLHHIGNPENRHPQHGAGPETRRHSLVHRARLFGRNCHDAAPSPLLLARMAEVVPIGRC